MLDRHVVPEADHQDGQREGGTQRDGLDQLAAPARDGDQHVDQRGQDEDLADLADGRRRAQGQPGSEHHPQPGPGPPEQAGQPRDDQCLERRIGHDRLLDLELVGVQQDRRRGQGGQPARHAAAAQDEVQRHGHGQAEQVLHRHHHGQRAHLEEELQGQLIAGGVIARVRPEQVLDRVDEQQRGMVGQLGEDPQHQPGGQQDGQQPVPPHHRGQARPGHDRRRRA